MITAVIFDMDDTLYNYSFANESALEILYEDISQRYHFPIDVIKTTYQKINQDIKRSNNHSNKFNKFVYIKQLCQRLDIPLYEVDIYLELYHTHFNSYCHLYDGVMDHFQYLKERHIDIAILSNNQGKQQYDKLKRFGLLEWVDVLITSDECGEEKPHGTMFITASGFLKEKGHHHVAMVGDNFSHDIEPFLGKDVACFHFIPSSSFHWKDNYCVFGSFIDLQNFFIHYYTGVHEYVFLSKYFGQSILNVQGCGGNISVKIDDVMMIKSSGTILGDTSDRKSYCVVRNRHMNGMKLWGDGHPSMEIFFHSFMKTYTIHIHFTLSNIFLCSATMEKVPFNDFELRHSIVDYISPGISLGEKIYEVYDRTIDIYFLKNHGVILTGDTIGYVLDTYQYIFHYFNHRLNDRFLREWSCFDLHRYLYYHTDYVPIVIRYIDFPIPLLQNIVYCFPDMAIFLQELVCINRLDELLTHTTYQVIIFQSSVYLCGKNIQNIIFLEELLQTYLILHQYSTGLSSITDIDGLRNMKEEKIRLEKHF